METTPKFQVGDKVTHAYFNNGEVWGVFPGAFFDEEDAVPIEAEYSVKFLELTTPKFVRESKLKARS